MTRISTITKNDTRVSIHIPSYLRDKFSLQDNKKVMISDDGKSIIITPVKEETI